MKTNHDTVSHDPRSQVDAGNPWYTTPQFEAQLGNPASRANVTRRWESFSNFLTAAARRKRVLDAGCGDGINLSGLADIYEKNGWTSTISGCDYNTLRLKRARELGVTDWLAAASLYELPYSAESFDVVLCSQVLEHLPEDCTALSEMYRVLSRDGSLIAAVPNEGCFLARVRNNFLQRSILRTTDHVNFYTARDFCEKIKKAGFEVQAVERESFFLPHLRLQNLISRYAPTRRLLDFARALIPSQAGGLLVLARKP